jgi:hypothetical protein
MLAKTAAINENQEMTDKRVVRQSKLSNLLVDAAEKISVFLHKGLPQYDWWNDVLKNKYRKDVRKTNYWSSLENKSHSEIRLEREDRAGKPFGKS